MLRSILFVLTAFLTISVLVAQPKTIRVPQDRATIQGAIDAAANGDTVLVAEGTYSVNLLLNKKIVLGSLFILDGNPGHISRTILDGESPSRPDTASVIYVYGIADTNTIIKGFTIRNGLGTVATYVNDVGSFVFRTGGGIATMGASARISNNVFNGNTCTRVGGNVSAAAIDIEPDPVTMIGRYWIIENNTIINNISTGDRAEGGALGFGGQGRFVNNVVRGNIASGMSFSSGGAVYVWGEKGTNQIVVQNNLFAENAAGYGSAVAGASTPVGGINYDPEVTFSNNLIAGNQASVCTIFLYSGHYRFINNTIVNNAVAGSSPGMGYTIRLEADRGAPVCLLLNTIVWNPTAAVGEFYNGGYATGSYNLVRGGFAGTGNISSDPLFTWGLPDSVNRVGWFRFNSPAANAGVASATVGGVLLTAPLTDYYGHARYGSAPDIGAFEDGPHSAAEDVVSETPSDFALDQNYPNPFNPETRIGYRLKERGWVNVAVHNMLGQKVAVLVDGEKAAGSYEAVFSSEYSVARLPSGVYFYRISVSSISGQRYEATRRMVLLK